MALPRCARDHSTDGQFSAAYIIPELVLWGNVAVDWTAEDEDTAAWVAAESARIAVADGEHADGISPPTGTRTVPDFAADARAVAAYHDALKAFVAAAVAHGIGVAREAHLARRAEFERALAGCEDVARECTAATIDASARYAPFVKRRRRAKNKKAAVARRPSLWLNVRTLWAAGRAHRRVVDAQAASATAQDAIRAARIALDRHDRRFENTVAARELELRRYYNSAEGKAALVREPSLRRLATRVDAIRSERAAYQTRFAAGDVAPDERRDREMASENYRFLAGPVTGAFFLGQVAYGSHRYHIVRDGDGRDWLLDWNDACRRIERLLLDVVRSDDGGFRVRRSTAPDRRVAGGDVVPHDAPLAPGERGARPAIVRAFADFADGFH